VAYCSSKRPRSFRASQLGVLGHGARTATYLYPIRNRRIQPADMAHAVVQDSDGMRGLQLRLSRVQHQQATNIKHQASWSCAGGGEAYQHCRVLGTFVRHCHRETHRNMR